MTDQQKQQLGKWGPLVGVAVALVAAMPVLQFLAQHAPGVTDWLVMNLKILWAVTYVKHGVGCILFGVLFSISWPYVLSLPLLGNKAMDSERAQASTRLFSFLVAFTLGCMLDESRIGIIFAFAYGMSTPLASMMAVRFLSKRAWYRPMALQPSPAEGEALMQRAAQASAPPIPADPPKGEPQPEN